MPDDQSWEELARLFEDLDADGALFLIWNYRPQDRAHAFGYGWFKHSVYVMSAGEPRRDTDSYRSLTEAKFRAYSTRAGKKMRRVDDRAMYWWFVELRLRNQNNVLAEGIEIDPSTGDEVRILRGQINDVCKMAAALCYSLEAYPQPHCETLWNDPVPETTTLSAGSANSDTAIERQAAIRRYKDECKASGATVTDEMIAKAASPSWNDRTQVTWWKRNDSRSKPHVDRAIRRVLDRKPHLKK